MTPPALVAGIVSGGFGHGNYILARIILPLACAFLGMYFGAGFFVSAVALIQWPMYGFLVDVSKRKSLAVILIVLLHVLLCLWLFTGKSMRF